MNDEYQIRKYYLSFTKEELKILFKEIKNIRVRTQILQILGFNICPKCEFDGNKISNFCSNCGFSMYENLLIHGFDIKRVN